MRVIFLFFFTLLIGTISAQSITGVRAVQSGDDIHVYYNLNDQHNRVFKVSLYCSTDGGMTWGAPLSMVEGDVKEGVKPGSGKRIIWHVLMERNTLTGNNIQFEVRALPASQPLAEFKGTVLLDTRDNQSYEVVKIANTYWMAENLNYSAPGSFCYDNDITKCEKYGRLYTWDEAKNACPAGWRLAEEKEWNELETHLGLEPSLISVMRWRGKDQGEQLKKGESSGFNALYGGFRSNRGTFDRIGVYSYFWSGTAYNVSTAYCRLLLYSNPAVYFTKYNKTMSMSVRCVKE